MRQLSAQSAVHCQWPGPTDPPLLSCRVPGPHPWLSPDRRLPEGNAETRRVGRAVVWRGEGLARLAPLPLTWPVEGEQRSALGGGGTKPQAVARQDRLGTAPRTHRPPRSRASRPSRLRSCRHYLATHAPPHPSFSTGWIIIQTQTEYRAEHALGPQRAALVAVLQAHFPQDTPRVALEEDEEPLPLARLCVEHIPPGRDSEVRACGWTLGDE